MILLYILLCIFSELLPWLVKVRPDLSSFLQHLWNQSICLVRIVVQLHLGIFATASIDRAQRANHRPCTGQSESLASFKLCGSCMDSILFGVNITSLACMPAQV